MRQGKVQDFLRLHRLPEFNRALQAGMSSSRQLLRSQPTRMQLHAGQEREMEVLINIRVFSFSEIIE
jgi:hypothetical protein